MILGFYSLWIFLLIGVCLSVIRLYLCWVSLLSSTIPLSFILVKEIQEQTVEIFFHVCVCASFTLLGSHLSLSITGLYTSEERKEQ